MDARSDERDAYNFRLGEIYNLNTGKNIQADYFLLQGNKVLFPFRYNLQKGIIRYGCPVCKTPVLLSKSKKGNWFFRHKKREEGVKCALVDENMSPFEKRIQRYNATKETEEHKKLKRIIAHYLNFERKLQGVPKVEKNFFDKAAPRKWKRPDVSCKYGNRDLVFEVQISNTWLSDIVARDSFYAQNQTSIVWVFNDFDSCKPANDITKADIFYNNPEFNLFVLDDEAIKRTEENGRLTLSCHFQVPKINFTSELIVDEWQQKFVTLSDFNYEQSNYRPYVVSYTEKRNEIAEKLTKWKNEKKNKGLRKTYHSHLQKKEVVANLATKIELPIQSKQSLEESCTKNFSEIGKNDCLNLLFGKYASRNINNLEIKIYDLNEWDGFNFPNDTLEILEKKGWIKKILSSHYERV